MSERNQTLFFDIETTGLSPDVSAITVIGCCTLDGKLSQWFNEDGFSQKKILQEFLDFLTPNTTLVSFNGKTFDLPFLKSKILEFGLPESLDHVKHIDVYQTLKPFRHLFSSHRFRQKDLEQYLNLSRRDTLSGKKLVKTYQSWLETKDSSYKKQVLLHNQEDVTGLRSIFSLLCYPSLIDGKFHVTSAVYENGQFHASLSLEKPWPVNESFQSDQITLEIRESTATLSCMASSGQLKHYHPDFENYFYLPQEDLVIPKSMASFVDKSSRIKASVQCCYSKFFPTDSFLLDSHAVFTFCKDNIYYLLRKK